MTITPQRLNELSKEIGQWAEKNFDIHDPSLGMVEETGEIAHCILKRKQGIRGFDDLEFFRKELSDGIADAAIYCLHRAHLHNAQIDAPTLRWHVGDDTDTKVILATLCESASYAMFDCDMTDDGSSVAEMFIGSLISLADGFAIDFSECLETTWLKVQQRDWRKNKIGAADVSVDSTQNPT